MLIACAEYREGRKVRDLPVEEISEALSVEGSFVWIALKDPTEDELAQVEEEFGLHPLAVADVINGSPRPKLQEFGDQLFVVMQPLDLENGELLVGEVDVFVGPGFVLSIRHRSTHGFSGLRAQCEREPDLLRFGPGYVLYAILDTVVDRYFPIVEALEDELERIEDSIFRGAGGRATIESIYDLKRKLSTVQHAARPLLEATGKMHGGRVPPPCSRFQDYYRDVAEHLARINQELESMRDSANAAVQANFSLITLQENEVVKRLGAWAALVAVPTLIAGIYGMNFQFMPELSWEVGYPLAIGMMVVVDFLIWGYFKRLRWV